MVLDMIPWRRWLRQGIEPPAAARTRSLLSAVGWLAVAGISLADLLLGKYLASSFLYLIPVGVVALAVGRWAGWGVALAAALAWCGSKFIQPDGLPLHTLLTNVALRASFYGLLVWALDAWNREKIYARKDFLTGIGNRKAFFEHAERELERSRRYRHPVTAAFLDCDQFKQVNDRWGHRTGDAILRVLAEALQRNFRKTDFVARLGSDEFAVLMPETPAEPITAVFQRVQPALLKALEARGWRVTVSVGAVTFFTPPASVDELVERADAQMSAAKHDSTEPRFRHVVVGSPGSPPASEAPPR